MSRCCSKVRRLWNNASVCALGSSASAMGRIRTATACVAPRHPAYQRVLRMTRSAWGLDNVTTLWRRDVGRVVAQGCPGPLEPDQRNNGGQRRACLRDPRHRHGLPCTPQHGAWLTQAAGCFGGWPHRFVARGSLPSATDVARCLARFVTDDQARHAHPSRWTSTGEPCVCATPCRRTRRQQRQERACVRPRPQRYARLLYAPRPSQRHAAELIKDLRNAVLGEKEGWRESIHRRKRCDCSLFQLGLRILEHFLNAEFPIPVQFHVTI